jgi:monoamine oxidase
MTAVAPVPRKVEVAIIGAGLAGLTAAEKLLSSGKTVLLIEARHQIGGKVLNRTLKNGGITEVGAEFVGPTQDAVLAMIKELGLSTFPVHDDGKYLLWRHNKRTPYAKKLWLDSLPPLSWLATIQLGIAQYRLDSMAAQIDVRMPWNHANAKQWDAITFEDWCKRWASTPDAKFMMEIVARSVWGAELREMSMLYVLSYLAGAGNETKKGTFERLVSVKNGAQEWRVVGGTGLICERLGKRIGSGNVLLDTPVTKVVSSRDGYRVEWEGGSVIAEQVVVAMPPPNIEKIQFEPALPDMRRNLNQKMRMGQMGKAIAIYEKPFWRSEGLNAQVFPDEGVISLTFDNSPEDGSFGALLGFFSGDEMRKVDKMTIEEIKKSVLADLVKFFGPRAAETIDFVVQRWGKEDHLWGGPTAVAPKGVFAKYGAALRDPVDRIHFAGTETSEYWPGYMDGAIRSGQRVASEILDTLR